MVIDIPNSTPFSSFSFNSPSLPPFANPRAHLMTVAFFSSVKSGASKSWSKISLTLSVISLSVVSFSSPTLRGSAKIILNVKTKKV